MTDTASLSTAVQLLPVSASNYLPHRLHSTARSWTENNCYVDVWVELLHSLGLDPLAAAAFALSTDFEGDQWTFYKYPAEDVRTAYGIDVHEMNPWRGTLQHALEQLRLGRLITMEADAYHLPDTAGVSYSIEHVKSTIVPNLIDAPNRHLEYFHNAGYFALDGEDFDAVFREGAHVSDGAGMPPYVELVRLDRMAVLPPRDLTDVAWGLLRGHVERVPDRDPIAAMAARLAADTAWVQSRPDSAFHLWAFATVRQCGASAELAGDFCSWLGGRCGDASLVAAAGEWKGLAEVAKAMQFQMARLARRRQVSLSEPLALMGTHWSRAQHLAAAALGA